MQANMGIAGEFRCVVKRADGSTKTDTGYQKNLILNQGLDFFGGNNGYTLFETCVIGTGNSQPSYAQNKLDATVAGVSGTEISYKTDYNASQDGNLYKINKVYKYSFTGLNNVNISEVGLASTYSNTSTYYLCTRALIKDSQGNPTTITILSGETLEIYYKLWMVTNITDVSGVMAVKDGIGGSIDYNYTVRPAYVGGSGNRDYIGKAFANDSTPAFYTDGLGQITGAPSNKIDNSSNPAVASMASYTKGDYRRIYFVDAATGSSNGLIRTIVVGTKFGYWQIQLGAATDNKAVQKTSTQTFMLRVEFSWARYEGAL